MVENILQLSNTHLNNIDHYPVASSLISAPLRGIAGITGTIVSLVEIVFHEIAATFHSYKGDNLKNLTHIQARNNTLVTLKASIDAIARAFIAAIPIFGNIVLSKYDGQIAELQAEKKGQNGRLNKTQKELQLSNKSIAGLISAQNIAYLTQKKALSDLDQANSKINTLTQEKQQAVDQLNIETEKLKGAEENIQALKQKLEKIAEEMRSLAIELQNGPINEDTNSISPEGLLDDSLAPADEPIENNTLLAPETLSPEDIRPEKLEMSPAEKKRSEIQAKKRAEKKRVYSRLKAAKAQSNRTNKFVAPILKKLRK